MAENPPASDNVYDGSKISTLEGLEAVRKKPSAADSSDVLLFSFALEAACAVANVAVNDHLTPAQQREGTGA